jgi:hypothetical protein
MKTNHTLEFPPSFGHRLKLPRKVVCCIGACVIALCSGNASAATVVYDQNGSFELGTMDAPVTFEQGSYPNVLTGWGVSSSWTQYNDALSPAWLADGEAQDGSHYLRLASRGGSRPTVSGVTWGLPEGTLSIGQDYLLRLWAAGGIGTLNTLDVWVSGEITRIDLPDYTVAEYNALGGIQWQQYEIPFTFTGLDPFNLISPVLASGNELNRSTIYLDNVSIVAVPEPGSALLLLSAAGMVVSFQRRRRVA